MRTRTGQSRKYPGFFLPVICWVMCFPVFGALAHVTKGPETSAFQVAFGPAAADDPGGIHHHLELFLKGVQRELVGAVHDWSLVAFAEQVAEMSKRGVHVEIAVEAKNTGALPQAHCLALMRGAGVKIHPVEKARGLMHHKFLVADGARVWTGSANFTVTCFYVNFNDALTICHSGLADAYRNEFHRLVDPYYRREAVGLPTSFTLPTGEKVTAHFSPGPPVPSRALSDAVDLAKEDIKFMVFAFSSFPIHGALKRACIRKVPVRGLFDDSFESESVWGRWQTVPFQSLWGAGADVKYDNRKARLHHKAMILDHQTVITGSFNYSSGADWRNNENFLVIESPQVARLYEVRHQALWGAFPQKTPYEQFLVDQKGKGHFDPEGQSPLPKVPFWATVEEPRHRGELLLKSKTGLHRVILAGLEFPQIGEEDFSQEPMATRCREALGACLAGKNCWVTPDTKGPGNHVWLKLASGPGSTNLGPLAQTILLESGWALLAPGGGPDLKPIWSILAGATNRALSQGKGLYQLPWALAESPRAFLDRLARRRLEREAAITRDALTSLCSNCVLADRLRGDFAQRGQVAWSDRYRLWGESKGAAILAFPDAARALGAGFKPIRGGSEGWESY